MFTNASLLSTPLIHAFPGMSLKSFVFFYHSPSAKGGYFHLPSVPCAFFGVIVSFPASKFSYLGERSELRENGRASGEAARGRGKENL